MPPLTYYAALPIPQGQSTDITAESGSEKDKDDMSLKDIFDYIKGLSGLPSDVEYFTKLISAFFSNPFNQENTSAMSAMYLNLINKANLFKFSKELFENSKTLIINKGGLNEIAINPNGYVYVKDAEGETTLVSPETFYQNRDKYAPITNDDLLNMRAYLNPMFDEIFTTINNGTGMKEITSRINEMINTLGTTEFKESNLTRGEKNGFILLANLAARGAIQPSNLEGLFKSELITKEQEPQIMAALRYIYTNLTPSEQALLKTKTGSDTEALKYIYDLYSAKASVNISIENTPYNDDTDIGKIKSNPLLQMINGEGGTVGPLTIIPSDGTQGFSVDATYYPSIYNIKSNCSIEELLSNSGLQTLMYKYGQRHITFGDLSLNPNDLQHVMYSNEGVSIAYLPCIITPDGGREVNFNVIEEYKTACEQFKQATGLSSPNLIQTEEQLNVWTKILTDNGLDQYIGINGKADTNLFSLFAVVDAYTTDKININEDSKFIDIIDKPDRSIEEMLTKGLSTNSLSDKDKGNYNYVVDVKDTMLPFEGRWDKIFKANVYIPIKSDPNAAINAFGDQVNQNIVSEFDRLTDIKNKRNNQNSNSANLLYL